MYRYSLVLAFFIQINISMCAQDINSSKKEVINGREIIYGETNIEQIFFDYPTWKRVYDRWDPDPEITSDILEIKDQLGEVELEIYLGTWCPDSKREVSRYYKLMDEAEFRDIVLAKLLALDTRKQLEGAPIEEKNIRRVPTFIFSRDGQEIGRIVEYPKESLEEDVLEILKLYLQN